MNIYSTPYFYQNIFLNPYTLHNDLPTNGNLGYTELGSTARNDVYLKINYITLSNIKLTPGVWLVMGYATFTIKGTNACGTLSITTETDQIDVVNNYTTSTTGQFPTFQEYFSLSITGIIAITTDATYGLSALSTSSESDDVFIQHGNTVTFNATRIA
jgi:hypothetical protein